MALPCGAMGWSAVVFPDGTHFLVGDEEEVQYAVCIFSKSGWLQDHFVDLGCVVLGNSEILMTHSQDLVAYGLTLLMFESMSGRLKSPPPQTFEARVLDGDICRVLSEHS